jgi:hypothetical protein
MSAQLTLDFARGEVAKLDKECREAFRAGSEAEGLHTIQLCWEFHRLHQLRKEARERLRHWELAVHGEPSNDTVPARGAEPLPR